MQQQIIPLKVSITVFVDLKWETSIDVAFYWSFKESRKNKLTQSWAVYIWKWISKKKYQDRVKRIKKNCSVDSQHY